MVKPRVLHCITVYNGRAFVPRAVESAMRMSAERADIDVLVLDDASPEPGWSEELAEFAARVGALYYRTPRNLGIPRNVSLGMKVALEQGYDFVTINNSDVIFPANLIDVMVECCTANDNVGAVTASSNNVSIYSARNNDPDEYLSSQPVVDFVSGAAQTAFQGQVVDIPAGISFAIMIPAKVIDAVGLMDPVFGRGYCEETDWSLRSLQAGYRICLAPGTFVYHEGGGSNVAAGLVAAGHTSVPENEAIIDMRYPEFRNQCHTFISAGGSNWYCEKLIHDVIDTAATRNGMAIQIDGLITETGVDQSVQVNIRLRDSHLTLDITHLGFLQQFTMSEDAACDYINLRFSLARKTFAMRDKGRLASRLATLFEPTPSILYAGYPLRV